VRRSFRRSVLVFALCALPLLAAPSIPELFQQAKQQFRFAKYRDALATIDRLARESQAPENDRYRPALLAPLAFYRGACLAALDQPQEAQAEFEIYLTYSPDAMLDPAIYSSKVTAALEQARQALRQRQEKPEQEGALAAAYRAFVPGGAERSAELSEEWANGPVRFLLTAENRRAYERLSDPVSRSEFVANFWKSRDTRPETVENETREEFERRVAFADARFAQDEVRGSLTDRGMVFVLLGPPTYIGRRPIRAGEDANEPSGDSRYSRNDLTMAVAGGGASSLMKYDQMTGPVSKMLEPSSNWREIWHYRRELLPKGVPYQQVDFDFITRKGYGKNVLQREDASLNTIDAARKAIVVDRSPGRASR
jgi:GWxTD domain-containing protein